MTVNHWVAGSSPAGGANLFLNTPFQSVLFKSRYKASPKELINWHSSKLSNPKCDVLRQFSVQRLNNVSLLTTVQAMNEPLDEETHYKLLSLLEENPDISQRQMAEAMGVSVGKINYCIKALVDVGHIKLKNFVNSNNKMGYAYFLTPKGVKEKADVTLKFLELKQRQYDLIKLEIQDLRKEIGQIVSSPTDKINK